MTPEVAVIATGFVVGMLFLYAAIVLEERESKKPEPPTETRRIGFKSGGDNAIR